MESLELSGCDALNIHNGSEDAIDEDILRLEAAGRNTPQQLGAGRDRYMRMESTRMREWRRCVSSDGNDLNRGL